MVYMHITLCIGKCKREICRKCDPELGNYNNVRFAAMTARGARTFAKVRLLHNEMIVNIIRGLDDDIIPSVCIV